GIPISPEHHPPSTASAGATVGPFRGPGRRPWCVPGLQPADDLVQVPLRGVDRDEHSLSATFWLDMPAAIMRRLGVGKGLHPRRSRPWCAARTTASDWRARLPDSRSATNSSAVLRTGAEQWERHVALAQGGPGLWSSGAARWTARASRSNSS